MQLLFEEIQAAAFDFEGWASMALFTHKEHTHHLCKLLHVCLMLRVLHLCVPPAQVCWAGPHTLALAGSQDTAVRMLQLDTDDNYVLDLKNTAFLGGAASRPGSAAGDSAGIVALVYEPGQQVLAAATAAGRVCLFKHWLSRAHAAAAAAAAAADPASQWEPSHSFWVSETCQHKKLVWFFAHACCVVFIPVCDQVFLDALGAAG